MRGRRLLCLGRDIRRRHATHLTLQLFKSHAQRMDLPLLLGNDVIEFIDMVFLKGKTGLEIDQLRVHSHSWGL